MQIGIPEISHPKSDTGTATGATKDSETPHVSSCLKMCFLCHGSGWNSSWRDTCFSFFFSFFLNDRGFSILVDVS